MKYIQNSVEGNLLENWYIQMGGKQLWYWWH